MNKILCYVMFCYVNHRRLAPRYVCCLDELAAELFSVNLQAKHAVPTNTGRLDNVMISHMSNEKASTHRAN